MLDNVIKISRKTALVCVLNPDQRQMGYKSCLFMMWELPRPWERQSELSRERAAPNGAESWNLTHRASRAWREGHSELQLSLQRGLACRRSRGLQYSPRTQQQWQTLSWSGISLVCSNDALTTLSIHLFPSPSKGTLLTWTQKGWDLARLSLCSI